MRVPVVAANWKMHKTAAESAAFIEAIRATSEDVGDREIVIAPAFPALQAAVEAARGTRIQISAQDLHWEARGAYTGEVSADMLTAIGCSHVIIGHSERREYFGETDGTVHLKILAALEAGLTPIVCVGETLDQREAGNTGVVLREQFTAGMGALSPEQFGELVLAYEPIWAIGTGRTATPDIADEAHSALRSMAAARFGDSAAEALRILYGGSVKPGNFSGLLEREGIDGGLVGGASLDPESYAALLCA